MKVNTKNSNYVNHIGFVIDRSGSMQSLVNSVIRTFDSQIENLRRRAKETGQETRVSIYTFSSDVECVVWDRDVESVKSLRDYYNIGGNTALIDATLKAISDLKQIPTAYGDHSFLLYVLTDGENNINNRASETLARTIRNLEDNWTMAILVPNQNGVYEAKKFGFPAGNIQVWETTERGMETLGERIGTATDCYYAARATGMKGTNNLFSLDASALKPKDVVKKLEPLAPNQYHQLRVNRDKPIREFVEAWKIPFVQGSCYYQITKKEAIQPYKQILVQDKMNGKVYSGDEARKMLGLPDYEVKVDPTLHGKFNLFIQSTSVNRKLIGGTELIVLK